MCTWLTEDYLKQVLVRSANFEKNCKEHQTNNFIKLLLYKYEPPHDKTNKVSVRPAKTQISLRSPHEESLDP